MLADLEADRAAPKITDLVEQEDHHLTSHKQRLPDSWQGAKHAPQDASDIPVWVTADRHKCTRKRGGLVHFKYKNPR